MSVVLRGLALDVDSESSVVAFGLAVDIGASPTLDDLEATGIEQWYAIDYRVRKRRPVTEAEWRRIRRLWRVWERSRVDRERKEALLRRQADEFVPLAMPPLTMTPKKPPRRRGIQDPRTGRYVSRP